MLIAGVVVLIHLALWGPWPTLAVQSFKQWLTGIGEVLAIVPAVLILIGLFDVWVPKEVVERGLGPASGLRGILFAILLGTGAAGPIYAAFPIGLSLREKGARTANLVIFLGVWATIKLPMLMMESAFLGTRFAMLRLAITLPGIIMCGFVMEFLDPKPSTEPAFLIRE
ncbi:permease [Geothrix limicola]|nr:permease [Geothrix limicola]